MEEIGGDRIKIPQLSHTIGFMNIPHPSTYLILFGSVKLLPELEHVGVFILRDTAVSAAGGAPGSAAGETIELTLQTIDLGHQIGLFLLPRPVCHSSARSEKFSYEESITENAQDFHCVCN